MAVESVPLTSLSYLASEGDKALNPAETGCARVSGDTQGGTSTLRGEGEGWREGLWKEATRRDGIN